MMKRHKGKVAFLAGGSRGIGAAIVNRLAEEGARVAFTFNGSLDRPVRWSEQEKSSAIDPLKFKRTALAAMATACMATA